MKIGDEVYIHGYVDEIRKDTVIIRNEGGYFGTIPSEVNRQETVTEFADRCRECGARYGRLLRQTSKTDRLYSWLNDMRLGIAPDETVTDIDERNARIAQTDLLDEIMEWLEKNGQEPKTGHWYRGEKDKYGYYHFHCSECNEEIQTKNKDFCDPYCCMCGAKMESEE